MSTALIVGGTSGVGLATARRLRANGATVHVVGRGAGRLAELAAADPEITTHQADGGDRRAIAAVAERIGSIDWLVATLSGNEGSGAIADLDLGMLRRAFEDKFWAQLTTIQAVLPHLTPTGSITLMSAITARMGIPATAGIAALNGAVEALVRPLAVELAPIRVNVVAPGFVNTSWWSRLSDADREAYFDRAAKSLPTRRIATPEDVAEVVALAATNPNLTGTVFEADGGLRLVTVG